MIGVAKLMKQAQKMQKQMEDLQQQAQQERMHFSSGGGAVKITTDGRGDFVGLELDSDFLKEEKGFVESTLLGAFQEAQSKARKKYEDAMGQVSGGLSLPGLF